jgi:hypothetical protein
MMTAARGVTIAAPHFGGHPMRHRLSSPCALLLVTILLIGCGWILGCAHHPVPAPIAKLPGTPPQAAAQGPVIVRLVSRHYSVVISAGRTAPVYTIHDASGGLLASNVTLDQLRQSRVDLYDHLAPLIAPENSASARAWAGK